MSGHMAPERVGIPRVVAPCIVVRFGSAHSFGTELVWMWQLPSEISDRGGGVRV